MLTLSQTSPGFYMAAVQAFGKHCGKRRNCSYRAISPFPSVFYPFEELSANFFKFEFVVCILLLWKSLKFFVWERVKPACDEQDIVITLV